MMLDDINRFEPADEVAASAAVAAPGDEALMLFSQDAPPAPLGS